MPDVTSIKLHGWDKKPRTTLRSIKIGDIFLLELDAASFAAGRIISKVDIGHGVEILDLLLKQADITHQMIASSRRLCPPFFVDSYGLFDRKIEGDWRIVGHDSEFAAHEENTYFSYGGGQYWKVDIFGNESEISKSEAEKYPSYTPLGDLRVREKVGHLLKSGA
jgi:hypothetical protein